MRVQSEVHPPALLPARRHAGRGADRALAFRARTLRAIIGLLATILLVLACAATGLLVLELVRWFAEVRAPLAAGFGGWPMP